MREWEANANGGGKHLWTPDVMLCKARVAPSPAAIPLQVSLTLCNWAGKGHGPSRVLPPAPGFRRGMRLWDRAGNVQPAGRSAGTCRECSQRICHEELCSWLPSWGALQNMENAFQSSENSVCIINVWFSDGYVQHKCWRIVCVPCQST